MAVIEQQDKEQEVFFNFINSLKSPVTKEIYEGNIKTYLKFCKLNKLSELLTIQEPQKQIIKYIMSLRQKGLSTNSIHTMLYAIYHFYEMNDVVLNRKKINMFIGEPTLKAVDRPYYHEEIKKILDVSDLRMKCIVLLMSSAGLRIGAISELKLRNLEKVESCYKVTVYEGSKEMYYSFCTPECASFIDAYLEYRSKNGKPTGKHTLGDSFPLNLYYAYGIRNSFGITWDPLTGYLWDSENGPNFGDELNLVEPGFNSGWASVQGYWQPNREKIGPLNLKPDNLVTFNGRGKYSAPEFVWLNPAAPSAIKFLDSKKYGHEYENDLLVGDANYGNIYDFNLDKQRMQLNLSSKLSDKIANDVGELNDVIFAKDFGKVADMEIGPDGLLYVLSTQKHLTTIYRIIPR